MGGRANSGGRPPHCGHLRDRLPPFLDKRDRRRGRSAYLRINDRNTRDAYAVTQQEKAMITTFALFALIHQTSPAQTMTLKLTPSAKHIYQLTTGSRALGLDAAGNASLSFTKKDATSYTVSWPLTEFTATKGNFRP